MSSQRTPLFPSATQKQTQSMTLAVVPNSEVVYVEHPIQKSKDQALNWLENKSFNTDDAIAIAKLHVNEDLNHSQSKEKNSEETSGYRKRQHEDKETSHVKRTKDPHGKQHKRHKHTSRYNSDSEGGHSRHSKKKKKKHKKHKHGTKSSREGNVRKRSSSSSDDQEGMKSSNANTDGRHEERSVLPKATWIDELGSGTNETFYIDTIYDKNNLCFDSLHFTNTAFYRRLGKSCLGLDTDSQRISWQTNKDKKKSSKSDADRYFGKGKSKFNQDNAEAVLPVSDHANSTKPMQSYIAIVSETSKDAGSSEVDPLGVYDASTRQYIGDPQTGTSTTHPYPNVATVSHSEDKSVKSKQVAEFNKHLHANPHDVQKWLDFVKFQDTSEAISAASVGDNEMEKKRKTTLFRLEKKQSILQKALQHNPDNIELLLARLELFRESWSEAEQIKEWENVLKAHPDNMTLWQEYILFNQSTFSIFSVPKAVTVYEKCFEALHLQSSGSYDDQDNDGVEQRLNDELIDLLVQQCQFWRQSGHTEKAVAAFQAMIELNCFCPDNLGDNASLKGQIAFLEPFWDSNEPRFGENNAKGWNHWITKKEKGGWQEIPTQSLANPEDEENDSESLDNTKPLWQAWLHEEITREQHHLLPWRPDASRNETEDDCEDPERMVLFDDISGILFKVNSEHEKFSIILRFLEFLGIVTSPMSSSTSTSVHRHFSVLLEHPRQLSLDVGLTCSNESDQSSIGSGWQQGCVGIGSNCTPLDDGIGNGSLSKNKEWQELISNAFTQSVAVLEEPARTRLLVVWLRHELNSVSRQGTTKQQKKSVKAARKFAKKLLGQEENRNNVLLWEVFASWEWSLGNKEDAQKMLDMALSFAKQSKDAHHKMTVTQVMSTYADLLCCSGTGQNSSAMNASRQTEESLHILTTCVEGSKYAPYKTLSNQAIPSVTIIRSRKTYQEMLELAMKDYTEKACAHKWVESSGSYVVHLANCYARFQYLTVGLQAANVVMEKMLSFLKPSSDSCHPSSTPTHQIQQQLDYELVMMCYTRLVAHHVLCNPTPLSLLRNLVRRAMCEFPDNPAFMQLFISTEAKSHIAGRVRRYFDHATQEANTPVPWLCAISAEMQRQQVINSKSDASVSTTPAISETGISNRIRSLFDRAINHKASRHCVLLWRLYIQFEMHQRNNKRAQAIFYQALQHCPWAKVIYIDAVRYFPDKLQDLQDLLMEKELRIRAPLEEVELLLQG